MLHLRNTLHKQIFRKRYTFKTSILHHRVLRVILHLEHLPLRLETTVYTLKREVPKITFSPSFFPRNRPVGQTRCHSDFLLHFLYQSVALLTGHFCDTLVLSQTQKLSSKTTELTTAICLIQTRLVSQATPSLDGGVVTL